ncbi:hypothetical protein BDB00DRAFT_885412 [Zychaea mexicana]|uniref:uncharacterized protein n=1 Tax=Zychaea mexicana TaxID=64656 RepID=UPI0022FE2A04|nr:uncharacterized protein BDB00DRAFT_885412 [Zychaea mexicana]KAI9479504.1 hypothetical protein BDB00DRAFT_885412 [Zychaea mexicana]
MLGLDSIVITVPVQHGSTFRYFEYHSTRYVYQHDRDVFEQTVPDIAFDHGGLTSEQAADRLERLGPNFIHVLVPNFFQALWEELTGFFYIYQLMILWCYFYLAYWPIGVADTAVILLAAIIKVFVRLRSEKRVKSMAEYVGVCDVLRDDKWVCNLSSADLVPGDVIRVQSQQLVPVDAVLLKGDVVTDESSLTGEPLPIRKFPARDASFLEEKIHRLYAGTMVKQASSDSTALVMATRTNTDKGQLVQKILFPQPVSFIFNEQLKLVFAVLLCWALVLLGIGSWWLGGIGMTAWFYGTTCAAQVMNPLLPAILVVGQSVAGGRLKKNGIYSVDLPRILMAGKVRVFCFDKTGTLTNQGLEYNGVQPVVRHQIEKKEKNDSTATNLGLGEMKQHYQDLNPDIDHEQLLRMGLASCHSVTVLDDQYIGNPVDIVMFEATGAALDLAQETIHLRSHTPGVKGSQLRIIQRFEFQHARASMSVAAVDMDTGDIHVFVKGSFERLGEICANVPDNYDLQASKLARDGCYVLAMAHRNLGKQISEEAVCGWTRDQLESNVSMLGLVLFKNMLKPDTTDAIAQLKRGDIRTVMITGDNALTGVSIGQACGMLPSNRPVLLGDVRDEDGQVIWTDTETNMRHTTEKSEVFDGFELAITGNAFRTILKNDPERLRELLFSITIFARMTPIDKMLCIELFMEKVITAMCGDGGNDCGALRAAHVGIAMSEAEASVVSPFSTPSRTVKACVELVIQGRSALATSFASYKYLIMYGETMATVKLFTFYFTMSFSQWNFILIDAFITLFCAFAVTQAKAAKQLSAQRPTARILGPEVLASVLGQLVINALFLMGAFVMLYTHDDFFRCNEWDARAVDNSKWWLLGDSFETDVLTFVSLFQFVNAALIFNYGYLFRDRWYRNYLLLVVCAVFIAIVSYWELADPNPFGCAVRLNCGNPDVLESLGYPRPSYPIEPYNNPLGHNVLPQYFRYRLWVYSIGNMVATHAWELLVVLGPVRDWCKKRYVQNTGSF